MILFACILQGVRFDYEHRYDSLVSAELTCLKLAPSWKRISYLWRFIVKSFVVVVINRARELVWYMVYKHLTAEERGKIEAYLDEGLRPAEIARRLDRHRSTITREIQRGLKLEKPTVSHGCLIKLQVHKISLNCGKRTVELLKKPRFTIPNLF